MSQHINPTPKQTDVDSVNSKIGNVGSTNLQAQITSLNGKIGNVRNTDLQSQVTSLNRLLDEHVNDRIAHVTKEERNFWNNKINYALNESEETLIINRE